MICKKPILMGIDGVSKDLVIMSNSGFFVEPENPSDFVMNTKKLMDNESLCIEMGKNGYNYARKYFDRKKLSQKYLDLIKTELKHK